MPRPQSALTKFILSLPPSTSVKEVTAKANARGMKTSEANVHRVRRLQARKGRPAKPAVPAQKAPPSKPVSVRPEPVVHAAPVATAPASSHSAEGLLKAVAAELGLGHSIELLQAERAKVRAILGR
jgi:hypothetical protein